MKNVFLPLFLFLTYLLPAQTGLNLAFTLPHPKSQFYDFIVDQDTLIGYGIGFNNDVEWKQGLVIAKLDSLGNVLMSNFIQDSLGDLFAVHKHWGKIIPTSDGGYAATAATFYRESAFLLKFNHDLQVEFIKEYPDTVNLSNYFYFPFETAEGYFLFGAIQRPDFYDDGFIRHVDKQGNTLWFKYLSYSDFTNGLLDIKQLSDTLYVAGIGTATSPETGVVNLSVFTSDGTEVSFWMSEIEPETGYLRKIAAADSSGIMLYGLYKTDVIGTTALFQPTLSKLNLDFELEWVRHFGPIKSLVATNTLRDFATTIDGNYVAGGEVTLKTNPNTSARRHGWLYKFTPSGDSIWSRYIPTPFPDFYANGGFLGGVGVLSSGSIVAGGTAELEGGYYCWIVKVTNDGCLDTLFCQTSGSFEVPGQTMPGEMEVYPNPASRYVQVDSPFDILYIRMVDGLGREVWQQPGNRTGAIYLELPDHLPTGIYTLFVHTMQGKTLADRVFLNPRR